MKWKLSYKGSALCLSSGQVWLNRKHSKGLYLQDILEMIKENPNASYYSKKFIKRVTLGEVMSSGRFEELGEFREKYSSVDLNVINTDREFKKLPKNGKQLLSTIYRSTVRRT